MSPSETTIALELFHGRSSPEVDLQDWGADGPVFLVRWIHVTYTTCIRFGLAAGGEGELGFVEDLVFYDGVYYGDWSVMPHEVLDASPSLERRLMFFSSAKAKLPPSSAPEESH